VAAEFLDFPPSPELLRFHEGNITMSNAADYVPAHELLEVFGLWTFACR
jgi:hypothetical protein